MVVDRSFVELNRQSTGRIRTLAARLSEEEMLHPVGEHWTVAVVFAHLAFWDRRVLFALERTERDGKLFTPEIDLVVNDMALPFWAAIPPRQAAGIAVATAEELDARLEGFPPAMLGELYAFNKRWVVRALHRGEHLDEAEAALKK